MSDIWLEFMHLFLIMVIGGILVGYVINRISRRRTPKFCVACREEGKPVTLTRGSFGVEVFLWLLMFLPGMIYTAWRVTSKSVACRFCGSDNLVSIDSGIAKKLRIAPERRSKVIGFER